MYGVLFGERCGVVMEDGHRALSRPDHGTRTAIITMAAPDSVGPCAAAGKHLASASPHLPWEMIGVSTNPIMCAQADRAYGRRPRRARRLSGSTSAMAMSPQLRHPGGHRCGSSTPRRVPNIAADTVLDADPGDDK